MENSIPRGPWTRAAEPPTELGHDRETGGEARRAGRSAHPVSEKIFLLGSALGTFVVYCFSNPKPTWFYDYTYRIAEAILQGRLGLAETPPPWLNEMVPCGGEWYSVFPLGSVLTMIPLALLKAVHWIDRFPGGLVAAAAAGGTAAIFFLLSSRHGDALGRRLMLAFLPVLGTWAWANLAFAGAWQIALGFAVLGEAGALYFTLVRRRPLIAGLFFALAFGNRTEIILTAPIFVYFLTREDDASEDRLGAGEGKSGGWKSLLQSLWEQRRAAARFLISPFLLGVLTLAYNYARFSSPFDFGYARIPGVLQEPWYRHGIFSVRAIPENARQMLFEGWRRMDRYPYLVPTGFGGSIFLSCPFLLLLFRRGARDKAAKGAAWIAIVVLTFVLWCHGNPGGWQYSYRYAMVLIPWMFLVLDENGSGKISAAEMALFSVSVAINAYATYLFLWTNTMRA